MDRVQKIVNEEQDMEGVSGVDMAGDTVYADSIIDQVLDLDLAVEMTGVEIMDVGGDLYGAEDMVSVYEDDKVW